MLSEATSFAGKLSPVVGALIGGSVAAGATAAGCLPVYSVRTVPRGVQDAMLGSGAGVMLSASAFSLALPGIEAAEQAGHRGGAMLYVVSLEIIPESHRQGHENFATGGMLIGFVLMMLFDVALG